MFDILLKYKHLDTYKHRNYHMWSITENFGRIITFEGSKIMFHLFFGSLMPNGLKQKKTCQDVRHHISLSVYKQNLMHMCLVCLLSHGKGYAFFLIFYHFP